MHLLQVRCAAQSTCLIVGLRIKRNDCSVSVAIGRYFCCYSGKVVGSGGQTGLISTLSIWVSCMFYHHFIDLLFY